MGKSASRTLRSVPTSPCDVTPRRLGGYDLPAVPDLFFAPIPADRPDSWIDYDHAAIYLRETLPPREARKLWAAALSEYALHAESRPAVSAVGGGRRA